MAFTSKKYDDCKESVFPTAYDFDDDNYMQDLSSDDWFNVRQYENALNNGDESSAITHYNNIPNVEQKIFSASRWNKLRDAIKATQKYFIEEIEQLFRDTNTFISEKSNEIKEIIEQLFQQTGTYDNSKTYYRGDIATYVIDGDTYSYLCNNNSTQGIVPTNTAYWTCLTIKGDKGDPGVYNPRGEYQNEVTYYKYDCVAYNGASYIAIDTVINVVPDSDSTKWQVFLKGSLTDADTVDGKHADDFAPSGFGLGKACQIISEQNLNNIDGTGFFMGSLLTNCPSNDNGENSTAYGYRDDFWWYVEQFVHRDNYKRQVAYTVNSGIEYNNAVYTRAKDNGSWSKWEKTNEGNFVEYKEAVEDLFKVNPKGTCICKWDTATENTPLKAGLTVSGAGMAIINNTVGSQYTTYLVMPAESSDIFVAVSVNGELYKDWKKVSDADTLEGYTSSDFAKIASKNLSVFSIDQSQSNYVQLNIGDMVLKIAYGRAVASNQASQTILYGTVFQGVPTVLVDGTIKSGIQDTKNIIITNKDYSQFTIKRNVSSSLMTDRINEDITYVDWVAIGI